MDTRDIGRRRFRRIGGSLLSVAGLALAAHLGLQMARQTAEGLHQSLVSALRRRQLDLEVLQFGFELRGVVLHHPVIVSNQEGRRLTFEADQMVIEPDLWGSFLERRWVIVAVTVSRPVVEVLFERERRRKAAVEAPAERPTKRPSPRRGLPSRFRRSQAAEHPRFRYAVRRITLLDGELRVRGPGSGTPLIHLAKFSTDLVEPHANPLASSSLEALFADGAVRIAEVRAPQFRAANVTGRLQIEGRHLVLGRLRLECAKGPIDGLAIELDLATSSWQITPEPGATIDMSALEHCR